MAQIVNVEYFYLKCNQSLGTSYSQTNWGGADNIKRVINVEWLCKAAQKVYTDVHKPKAGHFLLLSNSFINGSQSLSKIVVDKAIVDKVIDYMVKARFTRLCDTDCACSHDLNCNCVCTTACGTACPSPGVCASSAACTCNCQCATPNCVCACNCNCACDCGSNTECDCDCKTQTPWECNCNITTNCACYPARPSAQNCTFPGSDCQSACECACQCWSDSGGSWSDSGGNSYCYCDCTDCYCTSDCTDCQCWGDTWRDNN
ncbi:MAG: hypothetical protein LBE13_12945 [Bacteroidales bacterium]|nr:hypothetical protein [Bacteroidales bacterium]